MGTTDKDYIGRAIATIDAFEVKLAAINATETLHKQKMRHYHRGLKTAAARLNDAASTCIMHSPATREPADGYLRSAKAIEALIQTEQNSEPAAGQSNVERGMSTKSDCFHPTYSKSGVSCPEQQLKLGQGKQKQDP
ncbi:hypothetical protein [uncultured Ruegeria sp.]|uniref:hypothetical protein n=1 Tax=uncultured Ruegeria sp. TaxID=259304 RepID=UPI0026065929|nr:hypothetical protein [uncultured Ruegeria sp.]